jgi:hypothetical protein
MTTGLIDVHFLSLLALAISLSLPHCVDILHASQDKEATLSVTATLAIVVFMTSIALAWDDYGFKAGTLIVLMASLISRVARVTKTPVFTVLSVAALLLYLNERSAAP